MLFPPLGTSFGGPPLVPIEMKCQKYIQNINILHIKQKKGRNKTIKHKETLQAKLKMSKLTEESKSKIMLYILLTKMKKQN